MRGRLTEPFERSHHYVQPVWGGSCVTKEFIRNQVARWGGGRDYKETFLVNQIKKEIEEVEDYKLYVICNRASIYYLSI